MNANLKIRQFENEIQIPYSNQQCKNSIINTIIAIVELKDDSSDSQGEFVFVLLPLYKGGKGDFVFVLIPLYKGGKGDSVFVLIPLYKGGKGDSVFILFFDRRICTLKLIYISLNPPKHIIDIIFHLIVIYSQYRQTILL